MCAVRIEASLFYSCFSSGPQMRRSFKDGHIGQIYEVMKKASPETMRDVKMRAFGKHLALMGVKKLHNPLWDQYLLNTALTDKPFRGNTESSGHHIILKSSDIW